MKNFFDHLEHARSRPHHERKRIAFLIASGISGLIAVVWLGTSLSVGAFAIHGTNFAEAVKLGNTVVQYAGGNGSTRALAGASAAQSGAAVPAHLEVIDDTPKAATTTPVEPTIIPF